MNNDNHLNLHLHDQMSAGFAAARDLLRWFGGSEFWYNLIL